MRRGLNNRVKQDGSPVSVNSFMCLLMRPHKCELLCLCVIL